MTNDDETAFRFGVFRIPSRDAERIREDSCSLNKLYAVLPLVLGSLSRIPFEFHDSQSTPDRRGAARSVWLTARGSPAVATTDRN